MRLDDARGHGAPKVVNFGPKVRDVGLSRAQVLTRHEGAAPQTEQGPEEEARDEREQRQHHPMSAMTNPSVRP